MFDTAAIVDDSVISQCLPFLPPDLEEKATTARNYIKESRFKNVVRTFSNHDTINSCNKPIIANLKRTKN